MGQFKRKFQVEEDVAYQPPLVSENSIDCPFMWGQNIGSVFFRFVTEHACDGHTDSRRGATGEAPGAWNICPPSGILAFFVGDDFGHWPHGNISYKSWK